MLKTVLVWFKNDLRVGDNEALFRACEESDFVIPVYCFDPRKFGKTTHFGFKKTGLFRSRFLLQSISDLKFALKDLGADLIIKYGKPEIEVFELAKKFQVSAVYCNEEICSEEVNVEKSLEDKLLTIDVSMEYFWEKTLINIDDLPMSIDLLPDIFTKFRKIVESNLIIRDPFPIPEAVPVPEELPTSDLPSLKDLGFENTESKSFTDYFKGGETLGLQRLKHYLWETDLLQAYKETRNGLLGKDYSSKFSLWLANGSLSPRTIYWEIKEYEQTRIQNESTYWMFFELLWRDYFKFVSIKYGDLIFKQNGIKGTKLKRNENRAKLASWINGCTGIPFIDANMRELKETGFMSNRGRQNVASFLVKDLELNWLMGAEYFESVLIDYDPSSNYGNWNYVSGIGNDPREDRYFNVLTQAKRYDEGGDYVRQWVPELSALPSTRIHEPFLLKEPEQKFLNLEIGRDYPKPCFNIYTWKALKKKKDRLV